MKEKKPVFSIQGENLDGKFKVIPEEFFGISRIPKKVIIIGQVEEGLIAMGDKITIKNGDQIIEETVRTIQINKETVNHAVKGESIGICLSRTNLKKLRKFNG